MRRNKLAVQAIVASAVARVYKGACRQWGPGAKATGQGVRGEPPEAKRYLTFAKQNFSIRVKLYNMLEPGSMTMKNET